MSTAEPASLFEQPRAPRLGDTLMAKGLITQAQLEHGLIEQRRSGGRLGEVLIRLGHVFESDLARAVAAQSGLPFVNIAVHSVDLNAAATLAESIAKEVGAVPVRFLLDGAVLVAVIDPFDVDVAVLHAAIGRPVRLAIAEASAVHTAWRHAYGS